MFGKNWIIFDGQTGDIFPVEKFPFDIGTGAAADLPLFDLDLLEVHCSIENGASGLILQCASGVSNIIVNGKAIQSRPLELNEDYLILLGRNTLALRGGDGLEDWLDGLNSDRWSVYDPDSDKFYGPYLFSDLIETANQGAFNLNWYVHLDGMSGAATLHQILEAFKQTIPPQQASSAVEMTPEQTPPPQSDSSSSELNGHRKIDPDKGDLTCPVCWLHFNTEDIMHVATHPDLVGDSILGQDAPTRFFATRFDEQNRALDPKGSPCIEMACPLCRRELPPEFIGGSNQIISLVADSTAGKSYYLAVLSKLLPEILFRKMNVVFQDANPKGNAKLTDLREKLFNANDPGEAILARTVMEGDMYARCKRHDREVQMPFPFIYSISKEGKQDRSLVVFYDNAGEHFQPHVDIVQQPGAQHVSSAAGIIFLFDPFCSAEFRSFMKNPEDIPKTLIQSDRHDVILAEMKNRVHKLRNLPPSEKISTPLAVVLGKCDMWSHALPSPVRTDLVVDGQLNNSTLNENSTMLRQFLMEHAPKVVANAESFSSNVQYFATSSFGHVPPLIASDEGVKPAPDPAKLKPFQVESPALWILSQVTPELVL